MANTSNLMVSVLMTAYNRERYIAEAIESVLASTYSNFELIIVDDASKDNTVQIAQEYAKRDTRVKLYINETNLGDYPNRNKAASYASGVLLMYVDSDDSIQPNAISYLIEYFIRFPDVKFSLLYYHKDISEPLSLTPKESIYRHFYQKSFLNIGPGGTVIKKKLFNEIGGFPEKYGPASDMYYNLKVASNTNILLLPHIYLNYRIHEGQEANNKFSYLYNNQLYLVDAMKIPELPLTGTERQSLLKRKTRQNLYSFLYYLKETRNLKNTIKALKLSGIRFRDCF